jgi:hypothetical protein
VAPDIAAVGDWKHHDVSIPKVGACLGWQPASKPIEGMTSNGRRSNLHGTLLDIPPNHD